MSAPDCICSPADIAATGRCLTCPVTAEVESANGNGRLNNPAKRGIPRHRETEVIRHLASEDITRAALAREFSVTRSAITQFAQRHATEIEQVRAQIAAEDPWAGLWIARQQNRLGAYQSLFEEAAEQPPSAALITARAGVLSSVAEELGQLPGRGGIMVVPVSHVLVGVDVEVLK